MFGKNGPPRIVVVGNHELFTVDKQWFPNSWQTRMISADLPRHYENAWGEPYSEVLHKEVKGYHFFGNHWGVDEKHPGVMMAKYINGRVRAIANPAGFIAPPVTNARPLAPPAGFALRAQATRRLRRGRISFAAHEFSRIAGMRVAGYSGLE